MGKWKSGGTCHHLLLHMSRCFFLHYRFLLSTLSFLFTVVVSFLYYPSSGSDNTERDQMLLFVCILFPNSVEFNLPFCKFTLPDIFPFNLVVLSCYWPLCDSGDSGQAVVSSLSSGG